MDFSIRMFNPQPEPPAQQFDFVGGDHNPEPPTSPVGLLLPAVQAARE